MELHELLNEHEAWLAQSLQYAVDRREAVGVANALDVAIFYREQVEGTDTKDDGREKF